MWYHQKMILYIYFIHIQQTRDAMLLQPQVIFFNEVNDRDYGPCNGFSTYMIVLETLFNVKE